MTIEKTLIKETDKQMIFSNFFHVAEKPTYSHIVSLYDLIPRFQYKTPARVDGIYLPAIEHTFEYLGGKYRGFIAPAIIKEASGRVRYFHMGAREEFVEHALRKIAQDKGYHKNANGIFGVTFTLYQLQQELKHTGHTYDIAQIKDALEIISSVKVTISDVDQTKIIIESPIRTLVLTTVSEWASDGKDSKCFASFNTFIEAQLKAGNIRFLDYMSFMKEENSLARWMILKLYDPWHASDHMTPKKVLLTSIIRDSGLNVTGIAKAKHTVEIAINKLIKSGKFSSFETEKRFVGKKLYDVLYTIRLGGGVPTELKMLNARKRDIITQISHKPTD